jgi:hypothetical protein
VRDWPGGCARAIYRRCHVLIRFLVRAGTGRNAIDPRAA